MNTLKHKLAIAVLLAVSTMAGMAQFDFFSMPKMLVFPMMGTSNFTTTTTYASNDSPVDISGMEGIGVLIVTLTNCAVTNGVPTTGKSSVWLYGADNPTNSSWAALTNTSLAINNKGYITNFFLGITNLFVTNNYLTSGYISNATPSKDGFAGQWITAPNWTNTGVIATSVRGGIYALGIQLGTQPRYLSLMVSAEGSNTISSCGAVLIGRSKNPRYPPPQ